MEFGPLGDRETRRRVGKSFVAGVKATEKAVLNGLAHKVFVAIDAEERVVGALRELCEKQDVQVECELTMRELGKFCGLRVGAGACAVLKAENPKP